MTNFKPTYLYIKQHTVTGKLYFGKTVRDPEKYKGSGTRWRRHIKKHGRKNIINLWYCLFLDQESIREFALNFSEQQNIVESDDWMNLVPEDGLYGIGQSGEKNGMYKKTHSIKAKEAMSRKGSKHSDETLEKMREARSGAKNYTAKSWIITLPDSTEIKVEDFKAFCLDKKIPPTTLYTSASRGVPVTRGKFKGYSMKEFKILV